MIKRKMLLLVVPLVTALTWACQTISQDTGKPGANSELKIDASPVEQGEDSWRIASSDKVMVTVYAPGARSARILYRPIVETSRHILLKTINSSDAGGRDKFSSEVKLVPDFAGEVWAQISYPDGTSKETEPIQLAARTSPTAQSAQSGSTGTDSSANRNGSVGSSESAQSDKFTGGKIEQGPLQPGQPDIKITVNVPAFRLTLWQNGKEVRTYEIGVGMKKYPIVIGERNVTQVIWNPEWVPPDSEWVTESHSNVEPGEHVDAGDRRNPLGKLKIPLGDGFLIHQASKPSDLGHLVSHGCIRMLQDDISDLANKIVAARALNITPAQIDHAMKSTDRLVANLKPPIVVDINYDTLVVEGGVLHIYPDVYERNANTIENFRAELQSVGLDTANLDDVTLKQMLDRVNMNEEFKANLADIRSGNALVAGANQPLTSQSIVAKKQPAKSKARPGRRGRR